MSHGDSISLHCIILFPQQMLQNMPPQGNSLTDICQNLVRSRYKYVAYDKESKGKNNFLISENESFINNYYTVGTVCLIVKH